MLGSHRYTQIFNCLILNDICRVGKVFLPTLHFDLYIMMSAWFEKTLLSYESFPNRFIPK